MHAVTITLAKESDKDNLLEILKAWEQGGVGIGKESWYGNNRYYSSDDMVYETVEEPSDFSVTYFVEKETSNE